MYIFFLIAGVSTPIMPILPYLNKLTNL